MCRRQNKNGENNMGKVFVSIKVPGEYAYNYVDTC